MSLIYIASSVAQQLLCARPTADVHMPNTCCAHVNQLMDGYLILVYLILLYSSSFGKSTVSRRFSICDCNVGIYILIMWCKLEVYVQVCPCL